MRRHVLEGQPSLRPNEQWIAQNVNYHEIDDPVSRCVYV